MNGVPKASEETVSPAAKRLAAFLGEWDVTGTLQAVGSDPAAVSGRWRFVKAADGWAVRGDMTTAIEGMGTFEECELIGFDPTENKVHMFSMNKYAVRDHIGDWLDEKRLSVVYTALPQGHDVTERMTIDFTNPEELHAEMIESEDGVVTITTELTLARTG